MRVVMGSRSSPPAAASTSSNISRPSQDIKKETQDDEIKEYAETAMNELLGWYGYDKVDRSDTQGLNLHHFASQRSPSDLETSDDSSSPGRRDASSSRDSPTPADPLTTPVPADCTVCSWCTKVVNDKQVFSVKTPTGQKAFCSEVCFSQCRRANFKRNKTCDWCRHVRHTVSYVDFQDGEYQLQFCSDKCLNQYKMNIFCRETQAHLQMHPHLQDGVPPSSSGGVGSSSSGGGLITPDMWMRDCRSGSPISDRSMSPPPKPVSPARTVTPEPPPPPPPVETRKMRLRRTGRRRTATITSPTDLRTNCSSPASGDEQYIPPKSHNNIPRLHPLPSASLMPPILHPPPRLYHPDPPRPPFMPHGLLPPPHIFSEHPRFPMLQPPIRPSPPPSRPPPLLPLPTRLPPSRPPYHQQQHHPPRSLLPPVTVMVPYPIVIPVPIPIPIPIPIFWPRGKTPEDFKEAAKSGQSFEKDDKTGEKSTVEGPVAAFLRVTAPPATTVPPPTTPETIDVEEVQQKPPRQPLRKRKRLVEGKTEEEGLGKRKFVPV